jgi:hypothetical protein
MLGRSRDLAPLTLRGEQESLPLQPDLPLKIRGIKGVMSVTIVTPADFIEHPEDVRAESGP